MTAPPTASTSPLAGQLLACECLIAFSISIACCACGCGGSEAGTVEDHRASLPAEIQIDGEIWQLGEGLSVEEERQLTRYFDAQPLMIDNPFIQGTPTVYRHPSQAYRVYWITPIEQEVRWFAIEFRGQRLIGTFEGQGQALHAD